MKKTTFRLLSTALVLIGGTTATLANSLKDVPAAPSPTHYFRLEAGVAISNTDTGSWASPGGEDHQWAFEDDKSFYGGLAVGRNLMPGVRGDISFSANLGQDYDGCHIPRGAKSPRDCGRATVSTSADTYLVMANIFIEPLQLLGHQSGAIRPFLTAAIGVAWNDMGSWTRENPLAPQPVRVFEGDTSTEFAWAIGGGASIDLSSVLGRAATLDLTYRYVNAGEARGGVRADVGAGVPTEPLNFDVEFHAITAGIRVPF